VPDQRDDRDNGDQFAHANRSGAGCSVRAATGIRFIDLPLTRDRLWLALSRAEALPD
jgi:hypothetical protein